jgi:iron complex outermembrane receptor protein
MLAQNWSSVFTTPQTTDNQLAFLTGSASWKPTDTLSYQAVAYYRHFQQAHVDGNGTNAQNAGCPDPTVLCFPNLDGTVSNPTTTTGKTVPATAPWRRPSSARSIGPRRRPTASVAQRRRPPQPRCSVTATMSRSGERQSGSGAIRDHERAGHDLGHSADGPGTGLFVDQPSGDVAPVGLGAQTLYTGLYATDTFDVTSRLSVTAGARFNFAPINLHDELGNDPLLTGSHITATSIRRSVRPTR